MYKKSLGVYGEKLAENYIFNHGYNIIYRNWRCFYGEIDLVAFDSNGCLVFVEVKTCSQGKIYPYENFSKVKFAHLMRSIDIFLQTETKIKFKSWRLDLITIESKIKHFKHVHN